jgi:hypothetical protein
MASILSAMAIWNCPALAAMNADASEAGSMESSWDEGGQAQAPTLAGIGKRAMNAIGGQRVGTGFSPR